MRNNNLTKQEWREISLYPNIPVRLSCSSTVGYGATYKPSGSTCQEGLLKDQERRNKERLYEMPQNLNYIGSSMRWDLTGMLEYSRKEFKVSKPKRTITRYSEEQIKNILQSYASGKRAADLAKEYKCARGTMFKLIKENQG